MAGDTAMNNIDIARCYDVGGETVQLPPHDFDYVEVYSPDDGAELLSEDISDWFDGDICKISVTNKDSFQAAAELETPLVMNFANAHVAGGGFKLRVAVFCWEPMRRRRRFAGAAPSTPR